MDAREYLMDDGITLDAAELELALELNDDVPGESDAAAEPAGDYATSIRQALDTTGGHLLFHMPAEDGAGEVAAVAVGVGEERKVLMVTIPRDGEMRIVPSDRSPSPLARIAPSFADVMERLAA